MIDELSSLVNDNFKEIKELEQELETFWEMVDKNKVLELGDAKKLFEINLKMMDSYIVVVNNLIIALKTVNDTTGYYLDGLVYEDDDDETE